MYYRIVVVYGISTLDKIYEKLIHDLFKSSISTDNIIFMWKIKWNEIKNK